MHPQGDEADEVRILADEPDPVEAGASKLRAYLELCRAPALFTALADVLLGFFFAHRPGLYFAEYLQWTPPWALLATLLACSGLIYTAGMVLNDFFDAEVDARERPRRPIPSGRVSRSAAGWLGGLMLLAGVAFGWTASFQSGMARPGLIATGLAAAVLLYDGLLKKTLLGSLGMGACRMLNVLLGLSVAVDLASGAAVEFSATHYVLAGGVGLYIVGVTMFARREAETSHPALLAASMLVMAAGIALLAWYPNWAAEAGIELSLGPPITRWQQFMGLLGVLILYRCAMAIVNGGRPKLVQAAVVNSLRSLIVLDAFACLAAAGQGPALAIFALMAPSILLGRWLYST